MAFSPSRSNGGTGRRPRLVLRSSFFVLRLPVERSALAASGAATAAGLLVALAGTRLVAPDVSPWPRFWATAFFVLLLWPVGLGLVGALAGRRAQAGLAALLLAATVAQQSGVGSMPMPLADRWWAILTQPGDAIRQRIVLPDPQDRAWQQAWQRAERVVLAICTLEPVAPEAGATVAVNGGPAVPLVSLERRGEPQGWGWYHLPVRAQAVEGVRQLDVVVQRAGDGGAPAPIICGGQDDPTRPGAGGSARRRDGSWSAQRLADEPLVAAEHLPPSRFYVELRFYDAKGLPSVGIWY
jgi:hypothetical protein